MSLLTFGIIFIVFSYLFLLVRNFLLVNPKISENKNPKHRGESIRLLFISALFGLLGILFALFGLLTSYENILNFTGTKNFIVVFFFCLILLLLGGQMIKANTDIFSKLAERGYKTPSRPEDHKSWFTIGGSVLIILSIILLVYNFLL